MELIKKYRFWWLGMVLIAITYRLEFHSHFNHSISNDTPFYDETAINLASGKGYSWRPEEILLPVSHHTPGYSLFLSLIYVFIPLSEPLSHLAPRIQAVMVVQHVMSLVTSFLYILSFSALGPPLWLLVIFSLVMMSFVPFIVFSSLMLPETLSLFMVAVFVWGVVYLKKRAQLWPLWWGVWLGMLLLVKPYFVYFPLAYAVWMLVSGTVKKKNIRELGLAALGVLLVVGIWLTWVRLRAGIWVPMQRGYTFVVQQSQCPPTLCQATGSIIQKVNIATPEKLEDRQPVGVVEWLWWRTVHKWREYWGFIPEISHLIKDTSVGISFLHTGSRIMYLTAWAAAMLSLIYVKERNFERLLGWLLIGGALIVHTYIWSLPRYGLAMVPVVLLLGFSAIPKLKETLVNISAIRRWRFFGVLVSWPLSLMMFGSRWNGQSFTITVLALIYLFGLAYYFCKRLQQTVTVGKPVLPWLLSWWLTLMVIIMLPLYFSLLWPPFRWEHLPYPFVTRIGDVIIK
jgi:4-amino-4-deoxy-L-arabinose transferase-like glycosyltransferase